MAKILIAGAADWLADLGPTILGSDDLERVYAPTPSAALEVARAFVPSLVVVDGSDAAGCSFIRRLRESPGTRRSSILALSRSPSVPEEDLLRAGANLVLTGAPDPALWDSRIEKLLAVPRRLRIILPARVVSRTEGAAGESLEATTLDVSVTGMLLQTAAPLEPGTSVDIHFTLPGDGAELRATASVVRVTRGAPSHAGIRFLDVPLEARDRILGLLAAAAPEKAFGRYEVLGILGEGSMGQVYRAFDPLARRVVAIKSPKPETLTGLEAREYLERFRREAQAAARLGHPSIVTVFDVGEDYFAMELLEGATLEAVIRQRGPLPPEEACRILRPVAEALDHAHSMGTIHRDIKPANIMILADGRTKVMDFGVAHLSSAVITNGDKAFGSPAYMAPEQITNGSVTPLSDVFSLAVVAYETLSGKRPFEGKSITPVLYHVVHTDPPPPSTRNPALPPAYDDVFRKALAKEPSRRFPSGVAFLDALERRVEAGLPWVNPAPLPRPLPPPTPALQPLGPTLASPPTPLPAPTPPRAPPSPEASLSAAYAETMALGETPGAPGRRGRGLRAWVPAVIVAVALAGAALGRRQAPAGPKPAAPATGLQITTEPVGAMVLVDGKKMGIAPLLLSNVSPGPHAVHVDLKDFAPAELWVTFSEEAPLEPLRFVLQPLPATLEIQSEPAPALVKVDAGAAEATPVRDLHVKPGPHDVQVERPGFTPWAQAVDLAPGQTLRVVAHLKPIDPRAPKGSLRRLGWIHRGDLVSLGPGVSQPEKIEWAPPAYPEAARRLGMKGSVTIELVVSEKGEVLNPRIVESADEILDQAMLEAVRTWRYKPAESNGVQVQVYLRERHTFEPQPRAR